MKTLVITFGSLAILIVITALAKQTGISVTYQGSTSMPRGFYLIFPIKKINRGDTLVFTPPPSIIAFLNIHPWAPLNAHLMKTAVAIPGDLVCKRSDNIWINQHRFAPVYRYYAPNQLLPNIPFCGTLKETQYLLMSTRAPHSFDGRYFGPIDKNAIIGKAVKIL